MLSRIAVTATLLLTAAVAPADTPLWHAHTLDFEGPDTSEQATPNPFTDHRLDVTFTHEGGDAEYVVPGYYAADGDAANTGAEAGNVWRVHFAPDQTGAWTWTASFRSGEHVAVADDADAGEADDTIDGQTGTFTAVPTTAKAPDLRARGRLTYDGTRYPKTLGDGKVFLKAGADAPENFLAYADFDGDFKTDGHKDNLVKTWEPHVQDWREGDPTWGENERGKGIIGALNYLSGKGLNAVSMLTNNIEGDDRNVFIYTGYDERFRLDVSRLDQWQIVTNHAAAKGLFVHFKTQETENETILDDGDTGPMRKLYYRELIARFGHLPALNWNLGEENGKWPWAAHDKPKLQSTEQRLAMGRYFEQNDPYNHPIVAHNGQWPDDLYGPDSPYTGWSLQTEKEDFSQVHPKTLRILSDAKAAGKVWHVACDEPGDHRYSVLPDALDPGHYYPRVNALWGNLLAGGWGVEWYYGYREAHSDLSLQDHRSREIMYEQSAHALRFFADHDLPVGNMESHDDLVNGGEAFCLADPGHVYVAIIKHAAQGPTVQFQDHEGDFDIHWYDPRNGGELQLGTVETVTAGKAGHGDNQHKVGVPPKDIEKDWVLLVRAAE